MKLLAKTLAGLEEVLAKELTELGAKNITPLKRAVKFEGDQACLYRINLYARTALRVLCPLFTRQVKSTDDLYQVMLGYDWSQHLHPMRSFAIEPVVYSEYFNHSKYVALKAKDAIADFFRKREGVRPGVNIENPDLLINIHISASTLTVSLDSSGRSLHKRGIRTEHVEAPINEVLAAGILKIAGWNGQCPLFDPMCGSGTFLLEAALSAKNMPANYFNLNFGFQNWMDYDQDLFNKMLEDISPVPINHKIRGSDKDEMAVSAARHHCKMANLGRDVTIKKSDFFREQPPLDYGLIIINPPYDERLSLDDVMDFYKKIGDVLKFNYKGCTAWIISSDVKALKMVGLKPKTKIKMKNGPLDCELRGYDIF